MSDTLIKVEGLYKKFCMSLKRSMLWHYRCCARHVWHTDRQTGTSQKWILGITKYRITNLKIWKF